MRRTVLSIVVVNYRVVGLSLVRLRRMKEMNLRVFEANIYGKNK
jgi:hypothetical protein